MKTSYKIALLVAAGLCVFVIAYYASQDSGTTVEPSPNFASDTQNGGSGQSAQSGEDATHDATDAATPPPPAGEDADDASRPTLDSASRNTPGTDSDRTGGSTASGTSGADNTGDDDDGFMAELRRRQQEATDESADATANGSAGAPSNSGAASASNDTNAPDANAEADDTTETNPGRIDAPASDSATDDQLASADTDTTTNAPTSMNSPATDGAETGAPGAANSADMESSADTNATDTAAANTDDTAGPGAATDDTASADSSSDATDDTTSSDTDDFEFNTFDDAGTDTGNANATAGTGTEGATESGVSDSDVPDTYTIQAGDTFSSLAQRYYGNERRWVAIAQANPTVDPNRLSTGDEIRLPDPSSLSPVDADEAPSAPQEAVRYEVQAGDTLSDVARQYYNDPTRWRVIYQANRERIGDNPNRIRAGMELVVPPAPQGAE